MGKQASRESSESSIVKGTFGPIIRYRRDWYW